MNKIPVSFQKQNTALIVVDIQELFRTLIYDMNSVIANSSRLVRFCDRLEIPVIFSEQYSKAFGATVKEISEVAHQYKPVEKISFSCAGDSGFISKLESTKRKQIILCGLETHVCVYQTARDLLQKGYQISIAADAISSRNVSNRNLGLAYMRDLGVQVMTAEMIMFEILKIAKTADFELVSDILKENPQQGR